MLIRCRNCNKPIQLKEESILLKSGASIHKLTTNGHCLTGSSAVGVSKEKQ